ncbi:T9SS type A sorting domain-containing protein [Mongoliibacter sp.]|uniref:type IX secretion system anionic LPS delivery protein PorZ n=1 Tax=Mongoliibacter sp. TaxID=2022438 RepID=UPI0025FFF501|nr:T9SS type A sorting domain-containing protein [Mongoliibacter sp.]
MKTIISELMEQRDPKVYRLFLSKNRFWIIALFAILIYQRGFAQSNIPVGTWQVYNSYLDSGKLTGTETSVFSISQNAVFYLNVASKEVNTLTVLDGLYDQNFTAASFVPNTKKLILAYPDGTVQLVGERSISTLTALRDNVQIPLKKINAFEVKGDLVLVAGAFGMSLINSKNENFEASFTNLGRNGEALEILDLTEDSSRFYLATEDGLLIGNKSSNLNDFRNWARVRYDGFLLKEIGITEGQVFLIDENGFLFLLDKESLVLEPILGVSNAKNMRFFGERLFFQMENAVYTINGNGSWNLYYSKQEGDFSDYFISNSGFFLQVQGEGIVTENGTSFSPNAPSSKLKNIVPSTEGFIGIPYFQNIRGNILTSERQITSTLFQGRWEEVDAPEEILSVAQLNQDIYFGTNSGLWKKSRGKLEPIRLNGQQNQMSVQVLHTDQTGNLWIGLRDDAQRLFKLNSSGALEQVNVPGLAFPHKILSDRSANLWILQKTQTGNTRLQVFNANTELNRFIGNTEGFLTSTILDMDLDSNQQLWLGHENGVIYLPNVSGINAGSTINAITPIFQGRPLLSGISVTQVKVAPDQTKWFGTEREGLWRFSEFGDVLLEQFGRNNSPLVSNRIENLNLDPLSGEVLIVQGNAAFSYRGTSMESFESLESLKIFPNPVRPEFNGELSIEGLTDFANLKITSAAGRVVHSAQVRGGKATWNLSSLVGGRVQPGVYLVYVSDESGRERVAGKFVVL